MDGKIVIYSTDVHQDADKAKPGVMAASKALGVECDCLTPLAWVIHINIRDRAAFLELAREEAK